MRKKIKTLVNQNYELLKPHVIKQGGIIPSMLFFQFDKIDDKIVKGLSETQEGDVLEVENGFFVPISTEELMSSIEAFMHCLAATMATLKLVGIVGDLKAVTFSLCGKASKVRKDTEEVEAEIEMLILYGISDKEETTMMSKEIKTSLAGDQFVYSLKNTDFLEEGDTSTPVLATFFEMYREEIAKIEKNTDHYEFIKKEHEKVKENPLAFTCDVLDAAIHASTMLSRPNRH